MPNSSTKKPVASGRPAGLFTWIAIGVVLVVVAALVVVKVTSGSPGKNGGNTVTTPAMMAELTGIAPSVFNSVGLNSPSAPVAKPVVLTKQPLLTGLSSTGKPVPQILYVGAEYCPYCAGERWSVITALSRFGTWSGLQNTASYVGDYFPNTASFSFVTAKYSSPYLAFNGIEQFSNVPKPDKSGYEPLMTTPKKFNAVFLKYDTAQFVPGMSVANQYAYPFISLGNQYLVSGAQFTPGLLAGQSRDAIAAGLSTPSSPVTDGIIAAANYLTASICHLTHNQPMAVCTSPAVVNAASHL